MGDLHMPMSFGNVPDNTGRKIMLTILGSGKDRTKLTLFDFWNSHVIDKFATSNPSFWYSGWTRVMAKGQKFINAEKELWVNAENKTKIFEEWAKETRGVACKTSYTMGYDKPFEPNAEFGHHREYMAFEIIKQQILSAGVRLSIILNHMYNNDETKIPTVKLRQASGIPVPIGPEAESVDYGSSYTVRNLVFNLGILAVMLGGLVYFTRFYSTSTIAPSLVGRPAQKPSDKFY
eukprot:Trichotokara_eunicae@DN940_c0_g1_i1.p1